MTAATAARLEQAVYDAERDRDAAAASVRAAIADAVRAQLSDVPNRAADIRPTTTLEEVLADRLVAIRDALRAAGIDV